MKKHLLQALFVFIFGVITLPHLSAAITWNGIEGTIFYAGGKYAFSVSGDATPSVTISEGDATCAQTSTIGVTATYELRINASATGSVVLTANDGTTIDDLTITLSACDVVSYGAPFFEYTQSKTGSDSVATTGGSVKYIGIVTGFDNGGEHFYKINGDYQAKNNQLHIYLTEPLRINDRIAIRSSNASSTISQTYKIHTGDAKTYITTEGSVDKNQIIDIEYTIPVGSPFIGATDFIISRAHSNIRFNGFTISHSALVPLLTWSDNLKANTTIEKQQGDQFTYTASLSGSPSMGTISYSSDNTAVATVNATTGEVSVVGSGTAKITATLSESGCFEAATTSYYIHVAALEIIDESAAKFEYDDHYNADLNIQLSSGQYLKDMVTPLFVTATAATGYQWEKSTNGTSWSTIPEATTDTYIPFIPQLTQEGETNTTYYRCKVTGNSGSIYSKLDTVFVEKAEGCYPNVIIDAVTTSAKTVSVSGTIGGTGECKLQGSKVYDGKTGYKMGDDKHHMSATLKNGNTFQAGDVVQVFVTEVMDYGNATLHIYSDDGNNWIGSIDGIQNGWNEWYISENIAGSISNFNTICLYRHGAANDSTSNQNHYIAEIQVVRLEDCFNCAEKTPTITIPNELKVGTDYPISGTLEGAISGIWTEKSDFSHFGDVHSPSTTIRFDSVGAYDITWTVAQEPSTNRWGCRAQVQKAVTVTKEEPCLTTYGDTTAYVCKNSTFSWHGHYPAQTGDTWTTTNIAGCDSVVTLTIVSLDTMMVDTTAAICRAELPYKWHGKQLNNAGQLIDTLINKAGCDSIVTLTLSILEATTSDTTAYVCKNSTFSWHGHYPAQTGDTWTTTNVAGCDSVVTLTIVSLDTMMVDTAAAICRAELPYTWHDKQLNDAGQLIDTLVNKAGCDSIVTLTLTVLEKTVGDTTAYVCKNSTFSWHGHYPAKTGDTWTTTNIAGCDSVVTLTIVSLDTMMVDTADAVCRAMLPYKWHDKQLNDAGTLIDTLVNKAGCDSIVTLTLTVLEKTVGDTTAYVCKNSTFSWHGHYPAKTGDTWTTTNIAGCDSVVTLTIVSLDTMMVDTTAAICRAELPYTWHDKQLNDAGQIIDTLVNKAGCDSIVTLTLSVLEKTVGDTTAYVCKNSTFSWHGHYPAKTGDTWTTTNIAGCDSVVTLTIVSLDTMMVDTTAAICRAMLPYKWHNKQLNNAGTLIDTLVNKAGCDSIVTLTLTVLEPTTGDTTAYVCKNSTFSWHGHYPAKTGDTWTTTNIAGCDSVVTLTIVSLDTMMVDTTAAICRAELPYKWHGKQLNNAGQLIDTLVNKAGCDSIVTLTLSVLEATTGDTTAYVCKNSTFSWHGHYPAQTGDTWTTTNVAGCDSVVTLTIVSLDTMMVDTTAAICRAELPYTWHDKQLNDAGQIIDTLVNKAGCDSIVTLTLSVLEATTGDTTAYVCKNSTFSWHGHYPAQTGDTWTTTNIAGCDSVVTLTIVSLDTMMVDTTAAICRAELPYTWHGKQLNNAGQLIDTLVNKAGCDSIVTLTLTVLEKTVGDTTAYVCKNSTFSWHGHYPAQTGDTWTTTNVAGCDSVVTLTIVSLDTMMVDTTAAICRAELPYTWHGKQLNDAGQLIDTLINKAGCDSIVTLTLSILEATTSDTTAYVCKNSTFSWHGHYPAQTGDTWTTTNIAGCDSVVTLTIVSLDTMMVDTTAAICRAELPYTWHDKQLNDAGQLIDTLVNKAGCDSIVTLTLSILEATTSDTTAYVCKNSTFSWHGHYPAQTGDTWTTTNVAGCDSVVTLTIVSLDTMMVDTTAAICRAELPYTWHDKQLNNAGQLIDTLVNKAGCDSIVTLTLTVLEKTVGDTTAYVCKNSKFAWHGSEDAQDGDTWTTTNAAGCDSVVTLHIVSLDTMMVDTTAAICRAELPYTWHGKQLNDAGQLIDTLVNKAGCDSIVTLTLSILEATTSDTTAYVCKNSTFSWHGHYPAKTGDTWTTTNIAGCDSVVTLTIVSLDTMMVDTTAAICRAMLPYKWHGKQLSDAGQLIDTLVNKAGCDSIVTLTLSILEATTSDTTAYVCKNSTFSWHGHYPAQTGDTWTTTNIAGCDSVVTLTIVSLDTMMVDTTDAVCRAMLPYKWHNKQLNNAGTLIDTLINKAGCDSIVTLTLSILEATTSDTTAYVCKNSTFSWHGHYPAQTGDTWTTTNVAGCDSVVTLTIVYSPQPTTDSRDTTIYKGAEFDWRNIHIDHADTYRTTEVYTQGHFVGCDSAQFELDVTISNELVFDNHHLSNMWSDPKNWWPGYDRIPTDIDNVRIIEKCHVDKSNATAQDIKVHSTGANGQLTVLPQGALKVTGMLSHWDGSTISATTPADVLVQSNAFGNGVLVLNSDNVNVQGTVEYYSKAKDKTTPSPVWQYMGSPMKNKDTKTAYYGTDSEIYYWSDQPNYHLGGNWKVVDNTDDIVPFNGYCITQDNPYTYTFRGTLNQPFSTTINLPFYGHSRMPGYVLVANSWVAPIDITSMELSDFGNADATVYIFNSGTYNQAVAQTTMEQGTSLVPGQYNAIPVKAASYMGLTSIPPMQGFFVHTNSNTSMVLDYQRTIYDQANYSTEAMRAPHRTIAETAPYIIRFDMTAKHGADRLYLMESSLFTDEFDNGWEARYMENERHCALAANTKAGAMAVAALPDVAGTELQFEHGVDTRFFITIHTSGESQIEGTLYLHDLLLNTYTTIEEGATYEFTPQIYNGNRFRIERATEKITPQDELPLKFIRDEKLIIRIHGTEYNAVGGEVR